MSNDITPTQKLALAAELIEVVNRYCEDKQIPLYQASSALLLAFNASAPKETDWEAIRKNVLGL